MIENQRPDGLFVVLSINPDFSSVAAARGWRWLWLQGARRKMPTGVLDSTLRTFFECNAVDMGISAAAVGHW